jgi:CrcB protein
MKEILWVATGGIFGAVSRFLIGKWSARHLTATLPLATLFINLAGSLLIGFFLVWTTERVLADPRWRLLIAIGFCGAFTTYSSFAFETLKLYEQGNTKLALLNIVCNNFAALGAVVLGAVIARKV